jgi:hypothetical protein
MVALSGIGAGQVKHSATSDRMALLRARYESLNQAMLAASTGKFSAWMTKYAAPDFSLRSSDGNIAGAAATLSLMRSEFLVIKAVKASTFKLTNLSVHPDHTSCTIQTHLSAVTKDGTRIVEDTVAVDTWRLVHSDLKLATVVTTKDKLSANGKVVRATGIRPGEAFP